MLGAEIGFGKYLFGEPNSARFAVTDAGRDSGGQGAFPLLRRKWQKVVTASAI